MSIVLPTGGRNGHDMGNGVSLTARMPAIIVYLREVTARNKKSFIRMLEHNGMIPTLVDDMRGAFQVVGGIEQLEELTESKLIRNDEKGRWHYVVNDRIPFVGQSGNAHNGPLPKDVSASAKREAAMQRMGKTERLAALDIQAVKEMTPKEKRKLADIQLNARLDELERNNIPAKM